jgi:hypothetical protein
MALVAKDVANKRQEPNTDAWRSLPTTTTVQERGAARAVQSGWNPELWTLISGGRDTDRESSVLPARALADLRYRRR